MFRVGTSIIGIGLKGAKAVDAASKCGFSGAKLVCINADGLFFKGEYNCRSKQEFFEIADKLYMTNTDTSFVIADCSIPSDAALCCEICALSQKMNALTVAVIHIPSSKDDMYSVAMEYLEELHEVAHGVVVLNECYIESFESECAKFLFVVSKACDVNSPKRIASYEQLKEVFCQQNNIYFGAVKTNFRCDSHTYKAKSLALRLESQTFLDVATNIIYIVCSNGEPDKNILGEYINSIDKKNMAFLSNKKLCVSYRDLRLGEGEFLFAVLISQ